MTGEKYRAANPLCTGNGVNYFIVTPTKDEEMNIANLICLIEQQTIKPILWVIVDESTDNTRQIIKELTERQNWVKNIFLEENEGYLGVNYAIACKTGFDFACEYCMQHSIEYDYIGLIDADVSINEDFFERLMIEFKRDPKIGIASGSEYWNDSGGTVRAGLRADLTMGPARLWRRKCFEETGGYQSVASPDSVSNVTAKLRGWKTKQFRDVEVITRRTSTAKGYWWGSVREGKNYYFLNFHPFIILLKTIKALFKKPYYTALGLFIGYFGCTIQKNNKIKDDELRYYYRHIRTREIFQHYFNIFKNRFK